MHRKLEYYFGDIDGAIEELSKHEDLVYLEFNGQKLYSDKDDLNSAYLKVTGLTKEEFDQNRKTENEKYEIEKRQHEEAIPELTKEWIEKGKQILEEQYHKDWIKCVPIRLEDLYRGMELGMCLDIVRELNDGCSLDRAKEIIESQGHSGMSFGLVCSMIRSFCDRGLEFVNYVK